MLIFFKAAVIATVMDLPMIHSTVIIIFTNAILIMVIVHSSISSEDHTLIS